MLLSSASWMLSNAYDFPLPGHILIHGPSVSSFFLVPFDVYVLNIRMLKSLKKLESELIRWFTS